MMLTLTTLYRAIKTILTKARSQSYLQVNFIMIEANCI